MNLEQWQTRFLEYCRLQKNLSEHSLKAYQRDIDAFLKFLKNKMVSLALKILPKMKSAGFLLSCIKTN